jgi:hypothetical protein
VPNQAKADRSDRRPKKAAGHTCSTSPIKTNGRRAQNASIRALTITMPVPIAITARLERSKKAPEPWQKQREPTRVTKSDAQRVVDAYFSRQHFDDHEGCCPLLGTASDVERRGEIVKVAYQEVVEQLVKVFEDHLKGPRAHERALALVALCVGGMVLARNVRDSDLANNLRRSAHAEVLRTAGWK